jgi:flagellar biogenesis protein FliO
MRARGVAAAAALVTAAALAHAQDLPSAAASAASATSAAPIPFKQERQTTAELSGRALGSLLVCLLIGGGVIWLLRKRGIAGLPALQKSRRVQVLEVQRTGARQALVLVRWDDEELLIGQAEGQVQLIARKPAATVAGTEATR